MQKQQQIAIAGSELKRRDPLSEPVKMEARQMGKLEKTGGDGPQLKQVIKELMHRKTDGKTSPIEALGQIGIIQNLREHELRENLRQFVNNTDTVEVHQPRD